jgi:hypothetical protein
LRRYVWVTPSSSTGRDEADICRDGEGPERRE